MTEQEKELLIKDLCARLPYEVIIHFNEGIGEDDQVLYGYRKNGKYTQFNDGYFVDEFKPYFRPMKSMTSEERKECEKLMEVREARDTGGVDGAKWYVYHDTLASIDFLLSHHFDISGLIERGLAFEAPKGIYDI